MVRPSIQERFEAKLAESNNDAVIVKYDLYAFQEAYDRLPKSSNDVQNVKSRLAEHEKIVMQHNLTLGLHEQAIAKHNESIALQGNVIDEHNSTLQVLDKDMGDLLNFAVDHNKTLSDQKEQIYQNTEFLKWLHARSTKEARGDNYSVTYKQYLPEITAKNECSIDTGAQIHGFKYDGDEESYSGCICPPNYKTYYSYIEQTNSLAAAGCASDNIDLPYNDKLNKQIIHVIDADPIWYSLHVFEYAAAE